MQHDESQRVRSWRSAVQLESDFIGGSTRIKAVLRKLRTALVIDVMQQTGVPAGEAVELVSNNLIAWSKSMSSKEQVLRASPDAVRLLDVALKEQAPHAPSDWLSASQLKATYKGGDFDLNGKLRFLQDTLSRDMQGQFGMTVEEAASVVDRYFVGTRGRAAGGPKALYASPAAISILEDEGFLKRRGVSGKSISPKTLMRDRGMPSQKSPD